MVSLYLSGLFYEHDDRLETSDEDEEEEGKEAKGDGDASAGADADAEKGSETAVKSGKATTADEKAAAKPRRVLKSDAVDKWGHDKFMEMEQTPKSSEELVQVYGYDIRYDYASFLFGNH